MGLSETEIGLLWLRAVPVALPHVRVFRNSVVRGTVSGRGLRPDWYASAGIEGHGDAFWIAPPRMYENYYGQVEWKAKGGRMGASQMHWRTYCEPRGIPYLVMRVAKGEEPDQTVERWIDELRTAIA